MCYVDDNVILLKHTNDEKLFNFANICLSEVRSRSDNNNVQFNLNKSKYVILVLLKWLIFVLIYLFVIMYITAHI